MPGRGFSYTGFHKHYVPYGEQFDLSDTDDFENASSLTANSNYNDKQPSYYGKKSQKVKGLYRSVTSPNLSASKYRQKYFEDYGISLNEVVLNNSTRPTVETNDLKHWKDEEFQLIAGLSPIKTGEKSGTAQKLTSSLPLSCVLPTNQKPSIAKSVGSFRFIPKATTFHTSPFSSPKTLDCFTARAASSVGACAPFSGNVGPIGPAESPEALMSIISYDSPTISPKGSVTKRPPRSISSALKRRRNVVKPTSVLRSKSPKVGIRHIIKTAVWEEDEPLPPSNVGIRHVIKEVSSEWQDDETSPSTETTIKSDKQISKASSKTPSKTPSKTSSKGFSKTPSETPLKSLSKTPSKLTSKTTSETPLKSHSKSPSKLSSKTHSKTLPKTPSKTPSKIPSKTPSKTLSKTPSKTLSRTPSKTLSKTPSKTPSITPSISASIRTPHVLSPVYKDPYMPGGAGMPLYAQNSSFQEVQASKVSNDSCYSLQSWKHKRELNYRSVASAIGKETRVRTAIKPKTPVGVSIAALQTPVMKRRTGYSLNTRSVTPKRSQSFVHTSYIPRSAKCPVCKEPEQELFYKFQFKPKRVCLCRRERKKPVNLVTPVTAASRSEKKPQPPTERYSYRYRFTLRRPVSRYAAPKWQEDSGWDDVAGWGAEEGWEDQGGWEEHRAILPNQLRPEELKFLARHARDDNETMSDVSYPSQLSSPSSSGTLYNTNYPTSPQWSVNNYN